MGTALLLVGLAVGCGSTKGEKKRADAETSARVDVALIARDVISDTQHIARRVMHENRDRDLRRVMVKWQANTLDYCQRAMQRPDPRLAFVDIWTLVLRTKSFVQGEEGRKLLGDRWSIVDDGLAQMNRTLKQRAQKLVSAKHLAELEAAVNAYVARLAADGEDMADATSVRSTDDGVMSVIMSVPQGIFSLGGGVKDTAVSLTEVAQAARQGVEVMGSLPIRARWQTEMLLFSIEENEVVVRLLDDAARVSAATTKVGNTVESLPEKLEQTTIRVVKELEKTQPEFQKTLKEGRGIVDGANTAIDKVEPILAGVKENGKWIESAAGRATEAGTAWQGAFEQLNILAGSEDPEPAEPEEPFDFKDVVTTAEHATKTAESVRAAVEDLRAVVEGDAAGRHVATIEASTSAAIDRIARAAILVILTFFGALLAYRVVLIWVPARGS
ncbi:MAG: hypothetical protein ACYTEG_11875 [Planctomycetota bacterium]